MLRRGPAIFMSSDCTGPDHSLFTLSACVPTPVVVCDSGRCFQPNGLGVISFAHGRSG